MYNEMFKNQSSMGYQYPYQYSPYNSYSRNVNQQPRADHYTIRVIGNSVVSVKPDQASLSFGVVTEDMKVQDAQRENAILSNQIINSLSSIGVNKDEVKTESYTVEQMYDYPDGNKIFRGYKVTHMFKLVVKDLSKIGIILDTATQSGANVINDIKFEVSNPNYYYQEALKQATITARKQAESIATSLGLHLKPIPLWLEEEKKDLQPYKYSAPLLKATAEVPPTPVQEGEVKITATIKALFEYENFE